jgi:Flp pilus assembly protein TadG
VTKKTRSASRRWLLRGSSERGSSLVEFAIAASILLSMIFGVLNISMALYAYHYISDAAREGTRYAIVRGSACPLSECPSGSATQADIQDYLTAKPFPGIDPTRMTVTANWPDPADTCAPNVTPCNNPGNNVQVTVTYQFPLTVPFVPADMINMRSSSEMVISQ